MKVGIALLVGAVLLLLVVESVYDPPRTPDHVRDSQTHPQVDYHAREGFLGPGVDQMAGNSDKSKKIGAYKTKAAGTNNNKEPPSNEAPDYGNNKQKRRRRSIKKKLADRLLPQKKQEEETSSDTEKVLDSMHNFGASRPKVPHKIRHHHALKLHKDRIVLLNTTINDSHNQKLKARYRILSDSRIQIGRRKRYSYMTKDGVVHYTHTPAAPCNGWGYYGPYRCVQCQCTRGTCVRPCENVSQRTFPGPKPFPAPYLPRQPSHAHKPETGHTDYGTTTYKPPPPIYSGVGKYWVGPRLGCNCNPRGSEISTCDIATGQCRCKLFYTGRTCDRCQDGFWESIDGCIKCDCDIDGSRANICNQRTGQCDCKPGVGGLHCDNCLPNYYGFSPKGCKACEPCNKKGHICDPDTGRCICPPYSHGEYCHLCSINTWGYEPNKGCKQCNCSNSGSSKMQCNLNTGECSCRMGYTGFHCNRCAHGYFGYPRCRRCNCNFAGTDRYKAKCDKDGVCQCNEDGSCPCKANVSGKRCDDCKDGTFGMHRENPDGCTQCFCFGRSSKCTESGLTWGQIRMNSSRILTLNSLKYTEGLLNEIETSEKLLLIPGVHGNASVRHYHFDSPLYWKLHPLFNGDRILSYGGYLRFTSHTQNSNKRLPQDVLNHYPLVQLRGHGRIVLEYHPPLPSKTNRHEIRLHESLWKRIYPKDTHLSPRELLMVALQNIQNIFIKATDSSEFEALVLQDVILDTAIEVPGNPPPFAKGVEMCECPRQYNSSSCQDPSIGFFRYYTSSSVNGTIVIDTFVGQARPCECNGRSNVCDIETGHCLKCKANTDGRYCEKCAEGYYGNPMLPFGRCEPCPCPSTKQNFAKECRQISKGNQFICKCKPGYSGQQCDKCSSGYYGRPQQTPEGSCQPCNCNIEGRASDECDSETGQCNCRPGIIGKQCSQCEKPRHVLQKSKCTPCDECTQWLLNDIDSLSNQLYINTNFLQNGTIQPPWSTLKNIEKRYEYLNDKLAAYLEDKILAEELITNASLNELENHLQNMQDRLRKRNPEGVLQEGKDLLKNSQQAAKEMHESKHQLQKLIEILQNFGKSHLTTKEAVKQARELIRQIDSIAKSMKYPHKEVLQKCKDVKQMIEKMINKPTTDPQELKEQLFKLNHRIKALEEILTDTEITNNEAILKNTVNEIQINRLSKTVKDIKNTNEDINNELEQAKKNIDKTFKTLEDTRKIYDLLMYDSDFNTLLEKLEAKDADLNNFDPDKYSPVLEYVRQLEDNATEYAKLFNLSNKEIDALKASEAYANIKKFLDEAKKLAAEALSEINSALDTLSPEGKDSVAVSTAISVADSERLGIRVKHQRENLAGIKQRKDNLTLQVNTLDSNNWNNGLKNREQDNTLRDIKRRLSKINQQKIKELIDDAIEQTNRIKNIHRQVLDIDIAKQYELIKPYQRLLNLTTSDQLRKLQEQIDVTKEELKSIFERNHTYLDTIKENTEKYAQFRHRNNSVSSKLEELKAKIQIAKKTVDGIRISLAGPTCSRSYVINNLSPTLLTKLTIKFNYTMSADSTSASSLFYLNTSSDQFMNLIIVDNVLQFKWKLGSTINKVEYVLTQSDSYKVDVDRLGNYVEMIVTGTKGHDKVKENGRSENDTVIFKASPTDLVWVGYAPDGVQPGIPGCIRDVIIDDYRIGLWNFRSSEGHCYGCIRNNELTIESTYDFYIGNGFSLIPKHQQEQTTLLTASKFNVQFSLKTFDENALLFLAADPERKNFIAITLNNGFVQYQVHYPNPAINEDIILKTKHRCNTGEKIRISAEKEWKKTVRQDTARLRIDDDSKTLRRDNIDSNAVLRLKKVDYYFGGVPPGYSLTSSGITDSLHTYDSLLGVLEDLEGYQVFNDDNIKKYGVTKQSGELAFRKAWFEGTGHVHLKTKQLRNKILFLLRTKEANGFIMFIQDTASFAMYNGKLDAKFQISGNTYNLKSDLAINDDEYYLIELNRHKKKIVLKINGVIQGTVRIKELNMDDEVQNTSIYLGGVPEDLSSKLEGNSLFSGAISDILIDNELVKFNKSTIQYLKGVKIGRYEPQLPKIPTNLQRPILPDDSKSPTEGMKEMQNTEGCGKPLNYTFDPSAAKFGDKLHSHVLHYLKDTFWKKDFILEIQFRTFQPRGILLLSYGPKHHFNLLEIKEGKINFRINGKKQKEIALPQKVDDGQWYNVLIEAAGLKKKRKLTISINGYKTKPLRPPRNRITRELFIGGISQNVTIPSIIRSDLHPFRGCIRGLKINKIPQSLVRDKNTVHHNIGQCFPQIEKGSYFGGDAYAIYSKFFHIDKALELSLEFRTAEQNGILLSVSNPRNSPALSIELQNGAIVMTTDNGYGTITNVTNNLSDFALCNNQWHNVTAVYTSTEITINVDGIRKIWVQPDDETLMDELEAPLYIGGLPDYAPVGTLKMKENFKGCIRNMKIGDTTIDWINMEKVTNILLDSCPMIS